MGAGVGRGGPEREGGGGWANYSSKPGQVGLVSRF
jgi:hypothetical protein